MVKVELSTELLPLRIVGCLVCCKGRILLLKRQEGKRHAGYWGAAAGKIDGGEETPKAMVRELFEETGIIVNEKDLKLEHVFNVDQGDQRFTYNYFSLNLGKEPVIILSPKEHSEYKFFNKEELADLLMVPGELECMTYTLDHQNK